ncbi:putative oxidoreductase -like protein [Phaeoacremonium minimum UCRPA7]|uniref:Putative oxidoreductase-like protein n=1 Tax=Phaeoacremonium minimum (strain UCR-PA7) TaxID=1286976 RepID=R8BQI7_PHAM7|nr:putative oxidoreductase -like protein [Phaeoacremonium minimum UCRPA7]EOO01589.1 putative oxidoreductase -like protein [Phaeoacremonium minimum UCRPA7]
MNLKQQVAIAGATSGVGLAVLKEIFDAKLSPLILVRQGSNSASRLKARKDMKVIEVDYQDIRALANTLRGVDVVICTVGNAGLDMQISLIDAAIAAGVKRFIPSEFGADPEHPMNRRLPFYFPKLRILEYLKLRTAEISSFSFTRITTHAFLDWGLQERFLADPFAHKITIYNGGDTRFSVTTLPTIAKTVIAIIQNLEATENRAILIHDAAITQNELIHFAKMADGVEWDIQHKDTKVLLQESFNELKKPRPNVTKAMTGFTFVAVYDEEHDPDLTSKVDNKLLGLPVMDVEDVAEVIRTSMIKPHLR